MKLRIIALLISCCILLMSMSGCERINLISHTEDNPVSCTIDGIEYKSSPERVLNIGGGAHEFFEFDWGFFFELRRYVDSDMKSYLIVLNVEISESFELGKKYPINVRTEEYEYLGAGYLREYSSASTTHYVIAGWVEFTDFYKEYSNYYVSGVFEMDCLGSDDFPLRVRNGQFGPVIVGYGNMKE